MKIAYFRYYADGSKPNYPCDPVVFDEETLRYVTKWPTPTIFDKYNITLQSEEVKRKLTSLKRIIIQTLPGLKIKFYTRSNDPPISYVIGATGILDLDSSTTEILCSGLEIDDASKEILKSVDDGHFIMIVIYETEEKEES